MNNQIVQRVDVLERRAGRWPVNQINVVRQTRLFKRGGHRGKLFQRRRLGGRDPLSIVSATCCASRPVLIVYK
jgi:hypothetical protein